jgi:hypothetical protein
MNDESSAITNPNQLSSYYHVTMFSESFVMLRQWSTVIKPHKEGSAMGSMPVSRISYVYYDDCLTPLLVPPESALECDISDHPSVPIVLLEEA